MPGFRLLRYHHATLTVPSGSEDEARGFYIGVLSLREIAKPPGLHPGGLWLESGDGALQLHLTIQDDAQRQRDRAHLAFLTDDLAALRARLVAAGASIAESVAPIPGHARFECRDPFGNRLEFIQKVA